MGLLAEQILIDCPSWRLEELFSHRPATWLTPLLRLAGDEGELAGLALLGEGGAADRRQAPRRREHSVELGDASRTPASVRVPLSWRANDYRLLFGELDGSIEIRALGDHTVVGIEGSFTGPAPRAGSRPSPRAVAAMAGRRAAESAARSLLGHLRSAVEEPSSVAPAT